jgi:AcrR family transcriptional regulator
MTKIHNQDQIIDAAAKVFAEKGYEAARLQDIAAEVGVLQGSLYYHIGSKAGLLRMVRVRRFTTITNRIGEIADGDGTAPDKLHRAMRAHLNHIGQYLNESQQWFNNPANPGRTKAEQAEDHRLTTGYRANWATILREGMESGEFRSDLDVSMTVLSILGMLNWVPNWFSHRGRMTIDDVVDAQFELVVRSLRA